MGKVWWWVSGIVLVSAVLLRHDLLLLMGLLLLLVALFSYLWQKFSLSGVTYRRHVDQNRLFVGEETTLTVEFVNAKVLPLAWLRVEDQLPPGVTLLAPQVVSQTIGGRRYLVSLLSMRWYERVVRRYPLRADRRGVWQIGPAEVTTGGIFGFNIRRRTQMQPETVLVYPRILPMTALGLPANSPFGDARTKQRLLTDPLRLMGARSYVSGDSFRHIHWKATARRQSLQTKVFDPSAVLPIAIFLNINTFNYAFEGRDTRVQELAISVAASVATWASEGQVPVGLYVNSIVQPNARRVRIPPGNRPDQLMWMLEALAKVVDFGRWSIEDILTEEAPRLPYGATIVVVSAAMNERLRKTLLDLQRRAFGVVLITLGRGEWSPVVGIRHHHVPDHLGEELFESGSGESYSGESGSDELDQSESDEEAQGEPTTLALV